MTPILENKLMAQTKQNKVCKTFGIKFITSPEIIYLARNAGFHALFIDLEHSSLSLQTASHLCIAALNANISPFVRVPANAESGFVQRVLDNGAQGVVFPHVDSAEQAEKAVRASKYPPLGKRSVTGGLPHTGYKPIPLATLSSIGNDEISTVIVMIESPTGVANIDAIASTPGVDVVLVGTNDLSVELGIPGELDHPEFNQAVETIAESVRRHGKILGVAGVYNRGGILRRFIHSWGARFVVGHQDLGVLIKGCGDVVRELDGLEGECL